MCGLVFGALKVPKGTEVKKAVKSVASTPKGKVIKA